MDITRRRFLEGRGTGAPLFRPPWSLPETLFSESCTRCDACITACPTQLLRRGDGGFPVAEFSAASCTFCGDCARACTSGAIAADLTQAPWAFVVAIAANCLPSRGVECRVCGETCEARAISLKPRRGGPPLPEVDAAACTGCGACLAPCPVGAISRLARTAESSACVAIESPL